MDNEITTTKRGRGRPRLTEEEKAHRAELRAKGELPSNINLDPGDNARYVTHALAVRNLPPIDHKDPVQVETRINEYLTLCVANDMKPTVVGFCNSLGVTRQTLNNWRNGVHRVGTHEEIIIRAYGLLEELWESYASGGKMNPTVAVFLGCNNFGYHDVRQVNLTPVVNNDQDAVDVAAIEAKYEELPEGE